MLLRVLAAGLFACVISSAQSTITTIAGSRYIPFQDGIAAVNAPVGSVSGVTADKNGNVYFSDINTNKVYRVATNGIIATYAGSGTAGYAGDGGPARYLRRALQSPWPGLRRPRQPSQ